MSTAVRAALMRLEGSQLVSERTLVGCTDGEIAALEETLGLALPSAYRQFLGGAGKFAGSFMEGSDFLLNDLIDINEAAVELADDEGLGNEVRGHPVFLMHQGYQFLFFADGDSNDPPVMRFLEGEGIDQVASAFSEWLTRTISEETQAEEALPG